MLATVFSGSYITDLQEYAKVKGSFERVEKALIGHTLLCILLCAVLEIGHKVEAEL